MKVALLMAICFLYVDKPVASLQFDLETSGAITLEASVPKQLATAIVAGKTRVIIYGLNQDTFSGKFAQVSGAAQNVSNVIAAGPDGKPVAVSVSPLNQPKNVKVKRR